MTVTSVDQKVVESFRRLLAFGRLGHAYLFVGPKEIGKTQTALSIAKLVNCQSSQRRPCNECASCHKIEHGNHPDVMVLEPQQESIKIDQVRFLLGRMQLRAFEAITKVFIIRNVESMTIEAANSLLKTLEEPAPNTLIILTTAIAEANLDTIRSRCHVVKFFPSSRNRLEEVLQCPSSTAQFLSVYTDGCLGQARQLLEEDFLRRKNQILDSLMKEGLTKKGALDKEEARESLQILLSLIRDAVLLKTGVAIDELMHIDRLQDVRELAERSFEELSAMYGQVIRTRELLDENLNTKMAFNILKARLWDK